MNKKALLILIGLLILGFYFVNSSSSEVEVPASEEVAEVMEEDAAMEEAMKYVGNLEDVTGNNAYGVATASFDEVTGYDLSVIFGDLPDLEPNFFYEGWVVRRGENMSVISTGALEMDESGEYMNTYTSETDLTDHDFYVLTLEPDDGDPAPAAHILEGTMTLQ